MSFSTMPGTFRKSGGPGTATIAVAFANTGTVTNLIGDPEFQRGRLADRHLWHRRRCDHGIWRWELHDGCAAGHQRFGDL